MYVPSTAVWPKMMKKPKGRSILVLAPHMDDEIIGCGGTLMKHVASGDRVTVVYMTSGERGSKDFAVSDELCAIRKAETAEANRIMGLTGSVFFDLPDGSEESWDHMAPRLAELIGRLKPQTIYLPPYYDLHADHRKTNRLLHLACGDGYAGTVCIYEVWSPIRPNLLVNITAQMDKKLEAIHACASQLDAVPYDQMILSLNSYRATHAFAPELCKYAEAFRQLPAKEYWQEFDLDSL